MTAEINIGCFQLFSVKERQETLLNPAFLPTMAQIISAFVDPEGQNDINAWCKFRYNNQKLYDILNLEYIDTLANYILSRANKLGAKPRKPITILEVGAGDGRLAHFLRQRLNPDSITYIASDHPKGAIKHLFPDEPMVRFDYEDALQEYHPDIVICEWMLDKEDWTVNFRKTPSLKEYILIGETNGGCCGLEWETWGWDSYTNEALKKETPPYIKDGFERVNLTGNGWDHLCKSDISPRAPYHSGTVSFRRISAFPATDPGSE